jgi:hypothetical protein
MAKNPGMFTKANADRFCSNVDEPNAAVFDRAGNHF